MTQKTQKIISTALISLVAFGGLEALIKILNLNQERIFWNAAFWIGFYFFLQISLFFDLHFKNTGSFQRSKSKHESVRHWLFRAFKILGSTLWDRFEHLRKWTVLKHWLNYLILPAFLFWSAVIAIYINFGNVRVQQTYALLSSGALVVCIWYLKEVFSRKKEQVDEDIFVILSVVKIFAVALAYGAGMGIFRRYCIDAQIFSMGVFSVTFLFVYQALFQHNLVRLNTLLTTLIISSVQAVISYYVYVNWGYNYLTAAIFLTAFYNLFWGVFHFYLDKSLTKRAFLEILVICLIVAYLVLINTNFKAQLINAC
jgi:hypothetical protein